MNPGAPSPRVVDVLGNLVRRPGPMLVERWHWKSAVLSATSRSAVFFFANLAAGFDAAAAALVTEAVFRSATAGFYGATTEALHDAEPRWAASVVFTAFSTLFNLFAMRQGARRVGEGHDPLGRDRVRMPSIVVSFFAVGVRGCAPALGR